MNENHIICDIDGTVAEISHRLHFIQGKKKYYDAFFQACVGDEPIFPIINLLAALSFCGYSIIFVSGRSDIVREQTIEWLNRFLTFKNYRLIMRRAGDTRPDEIVKEEMLLEIKNGFIREGFFNNKIVLVLDDRKKVVDMWRRNGLTCLQVAEGNF